MNDPWRALGLLAERIVRLAPRDVRQVDLDEIVVALRRGEKALLELKSELMCVRAGRRRG